MERRLRSVARRAGAGDLDGYLAHLRRDVAAREAFLDHMTINVSELFRNPERFAELEREVLPELLRTAAGGGLRAWSAGCSYGAEPYTIGVLLREAAPAGAHEILATDLDERMLARAREGRFEEADMRAVTPARRAAWFEPDGAGGVRARDELRRMMRVRRLDLLADRFPERQDLILCRNVVIYFTDDAKDRLYRRFLEALRPGGVLFVGATERVPRAEEMGWEKAGMFFYRRLAPPGEMGRLVWAGATAVRRRLRCAHQQAVPIRSASSCTRKRRVDWRIWTSRAPACTLTVAVSASSPTAGRSLPTPVPGRRPPRCRCTEPTPSVEPSAASTATTSGRAGCSVRRSMRSARLRAWSGSSSVPTTPAGSYPSRSSRWPTRGPSASPVERSVPTQAKATGRRSAPRAPSSRSSARARVASAAGSSRRTSQSAAISITPAAG
jgi:chemotaxis protein methyltransferase CheR